jgi:hypothetical protein
VSPRPAAALAIYDLTFDWSDSANPNGPWAYREGTNLLPHVAAWQGLAGDFTSPQPAWARSESGTTNLPCFFRSSATVGIVHDWQTGDVICHSQDNFNGIGSGAANVTWTSPSYGAIKISGAIWMGRDIGRGNHWSIAFNGTELTAGDVFSGDAYDRATPMDFTAGSGGAAPLTAIPVVPGDVVMLTLTRTATPGDYSGIRMQVELIQNTGVGGGGPALGVRLDAPRPNPFRERMVLHYALARAGHATLAVHDVAGRLVQLLWDGDAAAGEHDAVWNSRVPGGIYFVSLDTAEGVQTRRVVVLP